MPRAEFLLDVGKRAVMLVAIGGAGVVTIVGSGGGLGMPDTICDTYPDACVPSVPMPSVVIEPPSATALVGTSVTYEAQTAHTSGALSYQWSRSADGGRTFTDLPGATQRSHAVAGVNLADDGTRFRVQVRQGAGLAIIATASLAVSATPGIVWEDGDFAPGAWQATPFLAPGSTAFVHTETRAETGGNPGALRRMNDQVPPGSSLSYTTHQASGAAYEPQVQGAIRFIDYAEDCIVFSASELSYVETGFFFEQGGRRYVTDRLRHLCTSRTWVRLRRPSLQPSDFRQLDGPACAPGEACPDFSAQGAPLHFGYERVALSMPDSGVVHGIENWRVTVWRR
jgi:hypothetical protein